MITSEKRIPFAFPKSKSFIYHEYLKDNGVIYRQQAL